MSSLDDLNIDFKTQARQLSSNPLDKLDIDFKKAAVTASKPESFYIEQTGKTVNLPSGGISRLKSIIGQSYSAGVKQKELSDLGFSAIFDKQNRSLYAQRIKKLQSEIPVMQKKGILEEALSATSEGVPGLLDIVESSLEGGIKGGIVGAGAGFIAGNITGVGVALPEELITVPGGAGFGARKGAALGATLEIFNQTAGASYLEFSSLKATGGEPMDDDVAALGALMSGAAQTGLEFIPIKKAIEIIPGSEQLFKKLGAKTSSYLQIPKTKNAFISFLKNVSTVTALEAGTEAAQEFIQAMTAEGLKIVDEGDYESTGREQILERVLDAAKQGALAAPGLSLPATGARLISDVTNSVKVAASTKGGEDVIQDNEMKSEALKARELVKKLENEKNKIISESPNRKAVQEKVKEIVAKQNKIVSDLRDSVGAIANQRIEEISNNVKFPDVKAVQARKSQISQEIKAIDNEADQIASRIADGIEQGKSVTVLENKIIKLMEDRAKLAQERSGLREGANIDKSQPLKIKKGQLEVAAERSYAQQVTQLTRGFKEGMRAAKKDIKIAQSAVINVLNKSGLEKKDKADFISSIKNINSTEQAAKKLPEIQRRILKKLDKQLRKDAVSRIEKIAKKAVKSNVIAADFARRIVDVVDQINTRSLRPETLESLQKTKDFFDKNPDQAPPKKVLDGLEKLAKTPIDEISTGDLLDIVGEVERLQAQGKAKQRLKQAAAEARLKKRLNTIEQGVSKPLISKEEIPRGVGEKLGVMQALRNKYTQFSNAARIRNISLNPMDVIYDMMDGGKQYKGATYTVFKKEIDNAYTSFLNYRDSLLDPVINLAKDLKMKDTNFERIGFFAIAQQENGVNKLKEAGYTEKDIADIKLTKDEQKVYSLMRETFDKMYPRINDVMVNVYNREVEQVDNYFPFLVDFENLKDNKIQDMVGSEAPLVQVNKKNVGKGFTIKRSNSNSPVRMDALGVFKQHVENASYLVEMGQSIKELSDVAASDKFENAVGDMGKKITVEWLDALARNGRYQDSIRALDILRRNTGAAILGFKLSTVLIQPTALMDGAALVGAGNVAEGVSKVATSKEWRKFLYDNVPEIRRRVGDDPAFIEMGGNDALDKYRQAGFYALQKIDELVAASVASGAYLNSIKSRGISLDLTKPDALAIEEAQLYMRRTQSSSFTKDIAPLTRGGLTGNSSVDRMILQFQSFVINRFSIIRHDIPSLAGQKPAAAANAIFFLSLATMGEVGLRRLGKEIIAGMMQTDTEDWEETISQEAVMATVGNVPIAGSIVASIEYGGSFPVPAVSFTTSLFEKLSRIYTAETTETTVRNTVGSIILSLGVLYGLPGTVQLEQITRDALKEDKKDVKL